MQSPTGPNRHLRCVLIAHQNLGGIEHPNRPSLTAVNRRSGPFLSTALLASLILFIEASAAQAQQSSASIDAQQNRSDALSASLRSVALSSVGANVWQGIPSASTEDGVTPAITSKLTFLGPIAYNDNILSTSANPQSAVHATPEFKYEWTDPIPRTDWTLYFAADTSDDWYINHDVANGDLADATVRVTYGDPKNDAGYKVMAYYTPTLSFSPTYSDLKSTSQDFAVAVSKSFGLSDSFYTEQVAGAPMALIFQLAAGRRLNDMRSSDFAKLTTEFDYEVNVEWTVQVQTLIQDRKYDLQSGLGRNDVLVSPDLTFAFTPYLNRYSSSGGYEVEEFLGSPEIDFQISYASNSSDVTGKSFRQWNIGPVIRANWSL